MAERISTSEGRHRLRALGTAEEKAENARGTVRRLLSYWSGERWLLVALTFLSVLSVVSALLCPYLLGRTVDDCVELVRSGGAESYRDALLLHLGIFVLFHLLSSLFSWINGYGMGVLAQRLLRRLKEELTKKLLSLSPRFFNDHL